LEVARRQNRVVVTQDVDFSALVALAGLKQPSLVTLRLSDSDPERVTGRLVAVLPKIEDRLVQGCAVTVEDATMRIRPLPIN
jgi:predicted nuclease of predicted toxin-antitoxin system